MSEYGIKLEPGDLDAEWWPRAYGELGGLCQEAREWGVSFVELSWGDDRSLDPLLEVGRTCAAAGLGCSIHPYLHGDLAPEAFDADRCGEGLGALLKAGAELAEASGTEVTIVFHGGVARWEPHFVEPPEAMARARAFYEWMDREVGRSFPSLRIFTETQLPHDAADEGLVRLGDTYAGCLELVGDTGAGVCWDFGHSWRSVMLEKEPPVPPEEFLERVGHVHAHDALWRGAGYFRDHLPLDDGHVPWRTYAALLAERGFQGRVLFELPMSHFVSLGPLGRAVRYAIEQMEPVLRA